MEEVVDHLQWKKELTISNGKSSWPPAMEELVDHLQWKK